MSCSNCNGFNIMTWAQLNGRSLEGQQKILCAGCGIMLIYEGGRFAGEAFHHVPGDVTVEKKEGKRLGRSTVQKLIELIRRRLSEYQELGPEYLNRDEAIIGALHELEHLDKMIETYLVSDPELRKKLRS